MKRYYLDLNFEKQNACGWYHGDEVDAELAARDKRIAELEAFVKERCNCKACGGSGRQVYGSTATWRGGCGGAAMTEDTCEKCWGSGDIARPGVNLRTLESKFASQNNRIADLELAIADVVEVWGANHGRLHEGNPSRADTVDDAMERLRSLLRKGGAE